MADTIETTLVKKPACVSIETIFQLQWRLLILHPHLEPSAVDDSEAPVRQCHRYLSQRGEQLDYQSAMKHDLPIGSGEIESAHRYLAQQRLKRPGAWWRAANADHMLALRINRANRQWDAYWADNFQQAA